MKSADYAHWLSLKQWTLDELAFLLLRKEPETTRAFYEGQNETDVHRLYKRLRKIAARDSDLNQRSPANGKFVATYDPIDKERLIKWVYQIGNIEVPKELAVLYSGQLDKADASELGSREKEHLLITIGLLSKVIAGNKSLTTGTVEKPNTSEIARRCAEMISDREGRPMIPGVAESTLRGRIAEGLKLIDKAI